MPTEESITIHETAPDGTETTIEVTSTKPDDAADGDKTIVDEVYEALFDDNADNDGDVHDPAIHHDPVTNDDDGVNNDPIAGHNLASDTDPAEIADPSTQGPPTEQELATESGSFTIGEDGFPPLDEQGNPVTEGETGDTSYSDSAAPDDDTSYSAISSDDTPSTTGSSDEAAADTETQAHADAARDAQDAADEFVAHGDYAAAAEARETAENEAYAAGDNSMLGAADSSDLSNAAYQQENADYYTQQQANHIAAGDYESAKEDAQNVAAATGDADYLAGGADHTGQADNDVYHLDNAVWNENNADQAASDAQWWADAGNADMAQHSAEQADYYQATADDHADLADPTSIGYDHDPSSDVTTGGSYEPVDYGHDATYDAGHDASYDAGVDMSASTYDPGTDTV